MLGSRNTKFFGKKQTFFFVAKLFFGGKSEPVSNPSGLPPIFPLVVISNFWGGGSGTDNKYVDFS